MLHVDPRTDILAVIDVQPTFMPGGELPVPEGDQVVPVINHLLWNRFRRAFATQDWHPPGHSSFASSHPGLAPFDTLQTRHGSQMLWPDHALQGTLNAALHPMLAQDRLQMILRKGTDPAIDSYSAFLENDGVTSTGLAGWLRDRGVRRIFFCGLATDICVAHSVRHAVEQRYDAVLVTDACRAIGRIDAEGRNSLERATHEMTGLGVTFLASAELAPGA